MVKLRKILLPSIAIFAAVAVTYQLGLANAGKAKNYGVFTAANAAGAIVSEGWSPTEPSPELGVYYPGTEALNPDEIRVIACGSGMPMPRLKQAAACFLIELGNGDKFIFDMGTGSMERIYALGIPLDFIDKVFVTHLHMDHMGDLPAFYIYGPQNNRSKPLRVWGPGGGGTKPEWGMKAAMKNVEKTWAWMTGTLAGTIDTRSFKLEVTEYDWSKVNNVIYEDNGVRIRTIPAIHLEQSVSFLLDWNGMSLAFSGDTVPNRWWVEHTKGVDFAIHECFLTPNQAIEKWGFSKPEALNALTKVHATAALFGKVMAMTRPKHAVAYHFQNDADTLPGVMAAVQSVYDGPVDYAQDFMVWNITKDGVRTRMAVANREAFPTPPLSEKIIDKSNPYIPPAWVNEGWAEEAIPFVEKIYADFNEEHGTNLKFR
jgi:ribonuclease Z